MRELIFNIDKWTAYLWRRLVAESEIIDGLVASGQRKVPTFPSFAREVFARLYWSPSRIERTRPEDAWASTLHGALDELPAFKKLTAHCARNKELASAATASLLEQLVEKLPDPASPLADPETRRKEARGLVDFLNGLKPGDEAAGADLHDALDTVKQLGREDVARMAAFSAGIDGDDVRQALRRSVDDAAQDVEEVATAAAGLSGLGGAALISDATQATLGAALKDSSMLRRLGVLAGRMRRLAMAKRRTRTRQAASEISDITMGDDLARILPHELMKLADPILSLDFFRALSERSLLQYELVGNDKEGRGPLVVLIDDSDSMDGAPATFARAAALALADVALADRRAAMLVRFSHRIRATLELRPSKDATHALLAFMSGAVDGGTNFELPLRVARDAIEGEPTFERADVVLITDGEAELSAEFVNDWRRRAARDGMTTYAVHIGAHAPQVLRSLTDDVIALASLLPERLEETLFARVT